MAKQTFTTGQVLTAAQMTSLQETAMGGGAATAKTASYVLTAADAGTTVAMNASGATTITVNTGLFAAGDTVFIQNLGTGVCTITAGTATVNTAGSLALPQYDAGILYFTSASAAIFYDYIQVGATSPLTTKGDLYTYSTSDTRLAVGANGTVLQADSAETTGLKWVTPATGGISSWTLLNAGGTALTGATTITISGISNRKQILILIAGGSSASASSFISARINADSGTNYSLFGGIVSPGSTYSPTILKPYGVYSADNRIQLGNLTGSANGTLSAAIFIDSADSTGWKRYIVTSGADTVSTTGTQEGYFAQGFWEGSASITEVSVISGTGNWDAGTVYVLGAS